MENQGKAAVITLDSLLNAPLVGAEEQESSEAALEAAVNPVTEVLPGLDPLIDNIPSVEDGIKKDAAPSDQTLPGENNIEDVIPTIDPLTAEPVIDTVAEAQASLIYKNTLKSIWGDEIGSFVQEVDGEEKEFTLDDIEVDEETFADILKSKIEEIKESATRNKISAEGISEFTQKLIEVEKSGGDIRSLLEMKQTYSDPLEGLDLDNVEDQKEIILLRGTASGQNERDLKRLIKSYEEEGILDEIAQEAHTTLREAIDNAMNIELDKAKENKERAEAAFKSYKKDLKDKMSQFELKDNIKSKLVDMATKINDKGALDIDERYNEARLDPEKASRLALFLYDEEEFVKQVTKKEVQSKQLETARKLKIIPRAHNIVDPGKQAPSGKTINISQLK